MSKEFKLEIYDDPSKHLYMKPLKPLQPPQGKWRIRMLAGSTTLCTALLNHNDMGEIIYEWGHGPVDHLQFFNPNVTFGKFNVKHSNF